MRMKMMNRERAQAILNQWIINEKYIHPLRSLMALEEEFSLTLLMYRYGIPNIMSALSEIVTCRAWIDVEGGHWIYGRSKVEGI
jgi:hypothetical protein